MHWNQVPHLPMRKTSVHQTALTISKDLILSAFTSYIPITEKPHKYLSLTKLSQEGMRNSEKKLAKENAFLDFFSPTQPLTAKCSQVLLGPFSLYTFLWYFHLQPIASTSIYRLIIPKSRSLNQVFLSSQSALQTSLPMSYGHLRKISIINSSFPLPPVNDHL